MSRTEKLLAASPPHIRFAFVGGIGFLVDTTAITVLFQIMHLDLALARVLAFLLAVSSNWILNRLYTFSDRALDGRKSVEWLRFLVSALLSAIPNLGVFFLLMMQLPKTLPWVIFATCCGILAGYFSNYQLARLWVYKARSN